MIIDFENKGGGSGSGSTVNWRQIVTGGTEIAQVTIDGSRQSVYTPEGIQGPQGERGEQGPQGERGEQGPAGSGDTCNTFKITITGDSVTNYAADMTGAEIKENINEGKIPFIYYNNCYTFVYNSKPSSSSALILEFSRISEAAEKTIDDIFRLEINNTDDELRIIRKSQNIQRELTAGEGIMISGDTISCTVTGGTGESNYKIVDTVADIDEPAEGMLAYEKKSVLAGITVNKGENTGGSFRITYEEGFSQEFYLNGDLGYLILQFDGHNIEPDGVWVNGSQGRIWAKWDGQVASIASTGTYDHISSGFDIEPVVTTDLTFLIELGEHSTLKQYNGEEWKERRLEYNAGDGIDIINSTIKCTGAGYKTLTTLSIDSDTGAYSIDEGKLYDVAYDIYRQCNRFWNDDAPQNVYMVYAIMGDNHYGYSVADIFYGDRGDGSGLYYNFHFGFRFYDPFENKYYYGLWLFDNNSESKVTFVKQTEF